MSQFKVGNDHWAMQAKAFTIESKCKIDYCCRLVPSESFENISSGKPTFVKALR